MEQAGQGSCGVVEGTCSVGDDAVRAGVDRVDVCPGGRADIDFHFEPGGPEAVTKRRSVIVPHDCVRVGSPSSSSQAQALST